MAFQRSQIPWNKGIPRTPEVRYKVSLARKGQHNSPSTEFKKGQIPWNKGLKGWDAGERHPFYGKKRTEVSRTKQSFTRKRLFAEGKLIGSMKGKHHSEETKRKISIAKTNKPNQKLSETRKRLFAEGKIVPWNKGKPYLQKENHPLWNIERSSYIRKKISEGLKEYYKHKQGKTIPWNAGKRLPKEMKEKIGLKSKQLWQNPEYREKVIKNSLKGLLKRPTSLEKRMINLIKIHKLSFAYCGDGTFLIGYKNPDFVETTGKPLCIEVANRVHHQGNWEIERVNHFKKYGWSCLVIWWDEIFSDKYGKVEALGWEENVLNKIKNFTSS